MSFVLQPFVILPKRKQIFVTVDLLHTQIFGRGVSTNAT